MNFMEAVISIARSPKPEDGSQKMGSEIVILWWYSGENQID